MFAAIKIHTTVFKKIHKPELDNLEIVQVFRFPLYYKTAIGLMRYWIYIPVLTCVGINVHTMTNTAVKSSHSPIL